MWAEIVGRALVRYQIDLSLVFYDLTAFYFEGEYTDSARVTFGFTRRHKGKKQCKLALNVTAKEKFPLSAKGGQSGGTELVAYLAVLLSSRVA